MLKDAHNDKANMLMLGRYNVYHYHHLSLVCYHTNICLLAINTKYS